jgi:hypothetical protein
MRSDTIGQMQFRSTFGRYLQRAVEPLDSSIHVRDYGAAGSTYHSLSGVNRFVSSVMDLGKL